MCQDVASGHPKGRSAAKEPRRGLTRGSVLAPSPTSCGSSHPLFAIYARIYTAANIDSAFAAFEALSRGLHALCVRFAAGVTPGPRNTRFRLVASLDRSGFSPAGSRRRFPSCLSVYMASPPHQALPGAITTHPCYQQHARRERSEWPPAGCNPGSPWTADSLRYGNRLRRICGCGSILRLSA